MENQEVETVEEVKEEVSEEKTLSQSDIDSQISKAVEKALANSNKKWESKLQQAVTVAQQKATEMAKLSEKERAERESDEARKAFEAEKEEFYRYQKTVETKEKLQICGLPTSLATSLVNLGDDDAINEAITSIKADWDSSIKEQVKGNARQSTPKEVKETSQSDGVNSSIADMAKQNRII